MSHKSIQGPYIALQRCYRQWAIKNFREVCFLHNHLCGLGLGRFSRVNLAANTENRAKKRKFSQGKIIKRHPSGTVQKDNDTYYI
jgi:hypothetical protein